MKSALLVLGLASYAYAACPNACSGNGRCESNDMCNCYANWQGSDCSLRTCMSGIAWITTAKGDINFDGDTNDLTIYDSDHTYTGSAVPYVTSPETGDAGDWERWPGYFFTGGDEGHFYMECSNRGLCDRSTGQCNCFPGYEGEACRRSVCPNDCSGHGTCETVSELATAAGVTYSLWDKDKSRACSCDAGYSGIACSERVCPYGDDPLTKANTNPEKDQADEIQHFDLYSDTSPFQGTIRLKYTDYYGKVWETDKISVGVPDDTVSPSGVTITGMQTATKDALESLPNDVIREVDVTVGPCSMVLTGQCDDSAFPLACDDGAGGAAATVFGAKSAFHCDGDANIYIDDNAGTGVGFEDYTGAAASPSAGAGVTCYAHRHIFCTRFSIKFKTQPGDIADLVVDTSQVSIELNSIQQTLSQNAANDVGVDVFDVLPIVDGTDTTQGSHASNTDVEYYSTSNTVALTIGDGADGNVGIDIGTNDKLIELGTTPSDWMLAVGAEITVACGSKGIGTYIIASVDPSGNDITVTETLPNCNTAAGQVPNDSDGNLHITLNTPWLLVDRVDVSNLVTPEEDHVKVHTTLTGAGSGVMPLVKAVRYPANDASGAGSEGTSVFLHWASADDANDDAAGSVSNAGFSLYNTGQKEASQCSDRGVCDRDTGLCNCFRGYTGEACELQNSLAM